MKRLCVVTGSRAEYGALRPFLRRARESSVFELQIVAAGMHLLPEYGETWREIEADGFEIDGAVPMKGVPPEALGAGVAWFSRQFDHLQPDLVLVEGDRVEALAATMAAAYSGIPVAHGGGGDVTGTIDNSARHSISHFASLHFCATDDSKRRLLQMGVPGDVHVTGGLGIDAIMERQFKARADTLADLGLPPDSRYLMVAFHPESGYEDNAGEWMRNVLRAAGECGDLVITYPNSDPGSHEIIKEIERFVAAFRKTVKAFPSLGSDRYLDALKHTDALVGNSSSGLYEAPSLRVPVVNVGARQRGRIKAVNVVDAGYGYESIAGTLKYVLSFEPWRAKLSYIKSPYGDGRAAERMMEIIERRLGE